MVKYMFFLLILLLGALFVIMVLSMSGFYAFVRGKIINPLININTAVDQMVENIDSGRLEDLYDLVSKTSSFLESYQGLRFVATKKEEIQGFGTSGYPLQLSEDVRASLRSLNKLIVDLSVS